MNNAVSAPVGQWVGSLDREVLMTAAAQQTGLSDFGDDAFVEPLGRFLRAVAEEARLTPEGWASTSMDVVRLLTNRLVHRRDQLAHPEIADEDVPDPIVITGLPRTGTTKLQRVLALDPLVQSLPLWRAMSPAPLVQPAGEDGRDPRIVVAEQQSAMMFEMFPGFMASHPMRAQDQEEEILLIQMTFEARGTGLMYRVPEYIKWLDGRSGTYQYEYLRDILRYLQWQDGGRRGRPWVLKSPPHLGRTDELLDTFPGALVVRCHRNPAEVVPSLCKFMRDLRPSRGIELVDQHELGRHMLEFCADEWRRHLALMDSLPADRIIDVPYERIEGDVSGVVADIYARRGVEVSADLRASIDRWEQDNPKHGFGAYEYALAEFGLDQEQIDAAFAEYLSRFPGGR